MTLAHEGTKKRSREAQSSGQHQMSPQHRPYKGKATQLPGMGGYESTWSAKGGHVPELAQVPAGWLQVPSVNLGDGGIGMGIQSLTLQDTRAKAVRGGQSIKSTPALSLQAIGVQPGRKQITNYNIPGLWRAYKTNEMVFAAIEIKAQSAINPRLLVQGRATSKGDWEELQGHPMRMLMLRPNPDMDEAAFTRAYFTSTDATGLFYAEVTRNERSNLPEGLYPLDPGCVTAVQREDGKYNYECRQGSQTTTILGENMLVKRVYDPQNRLAGLSRLAVAMGSVDADSAQTEYIREFFNNGGVPSGIIKIKGKRLTEAQAQELGAKWSKKYGRGTGRMHAPAVMDEDADYTKIGANLDELESQGIRSFTESRICMVFGIPPLIIYSYTGLLRATYSNLQEAWDNYWNGTLFYAYTDYKSWLTWALLTEFEGEDAIKLERRRLEWDFTHVPYLQEDTTAHQQKALEQFLGGSITLNELREVLHQPRDPAGDYYLRNEHQVAVPAGDPEALQPSSTAPVGEAGNPSAGAADPNLQVVPAKAFPYLAQLERAIKARATRQSLQHQVERLSGSAIHADWQSIIDELAAQNAE